MAIGDPIGGGPAPDAVGAILGRLAASHPGVGFALHAHQQHGVTPPGVNPGSAPMGLPPPALAGPPPGVRVGSPGQAFGAAPPRPPQAPRGPAAELRKAPPATIEKPPGARTIKRVR